MKLKNNIRRAHQLVKLPGSLIIHLICLLAVLPSVWKKPKPGQPRKTIREELDHTLQECHPEIAHLAETITILIYVVLIIIYQ